MRYTRKTPVSVEAIRLVHPVTIETPSGPIHGNAGDYLVTESERQYVMSAEAFEAAFEQASELILRVPEREYVPYPVYPQPYVAPKPLWWYNNDITITYAPTTSIANLPLGAPVVINDVSIPLDANASYTLS